MSEIELYSAVLCPFAYRARLTLAEKQVPFKLIEIDLQNKPTNFEEISPYGLVPLLKHGKFRIWESAIINEYLEESFPTPPLLPKDLVQRAQARIWINFADVRLFAATHKLLLTLEPLQQAEGVEELSKYLQFVEQEGLQKLSAEEPYWLGAEISLVDLTYYPWFEQVAVLEHFRGFQFPSGLNRLKKWYETVANRESVRAIAKPKEFYLKHYARLQSSASVIS
ncbi:glutathione S-transferase family protein [Leptolyngbya sp. FACHB-261]|uniref:glutathione S-transferase family protein n=1 Tax=Leptolyngbya sp. FACHB-261 TaxID=2692806 RepID=UPI0016858BC0|nr:glutathione S-transferase family protein [Leptolyngbya sp. FACHB-261]MBD2100383.1 glutathione S-transferase family protein [Leptolyngbya sp. FACHB-261]